MFWVIGRDQLACWGTFHRLRFCRNPKGSPNIQNFKTDSIVAIKTLLMGVAWSYEQMRNCLKIVLVTFWVHLIINLQSWPKIKFSQISRHSQKQEVTHRINHLVLKSQNKLRMTKFQADSINHQKNIAWQKTAKKAAEIFLKNKNLATLKPNKPAAPPMNNLP